jgi:NTP pyrophosphatase (non-canonical NTP hydrolase)
MIGPAPHVESGLAGELPRCAAVIADCLRRNGFGSGLADSLTIHQLNRQVLGLAEEAGEFVGAYRRWSGQARRSGTAEEMHEELADVIITAFVTAHELGVDINAVVAAKIRKIHTRGWRETTVSSERQPDPFDPLGTLNGSHVSNCPVNTEANPVPADCICVG